LFGHGIGKGCGLCGGSGHFGGKGCGACGGSGLCGTGHGTGCGLCGGKGCGACGGHGGLGHLAGLKGKLHGLIGSALGHNQVKYFVGPGGPVPLTPGYVPYVVPVRSPRDFFAFPPYSDIQQVDY
jgi:hypothetical protein